MMEVTQEEIDAAQTAFFTGVVKYAKTAGRPVAEFAAQFALGGCMMIERNLKQAEILGKRQEAQQRQATAEDEINTLNAQLRTIEGQILAAAMGQGN